MKKLQLYVLKDTLKALIPAFLTLMALMTVGFALQLLGDGLDVVRLSGLFGPLLSYSVPIVLPSAFLTAVIMSFGRLSADNELLAIRAGGISLMRIINPILGLAALLTLVAAFLQFETVPKARGKIETLKYKALQQILLDQVALSANRQFSFKSRAGEVIINYDDFQDGRMVGLLAVVARDQRPTYVIRARYCTIGPDPDAPNQQVVFEMDDCIWADFGAGQRTETQVMRAESGRIAVPVAVDPKDVMSEEKHLAFVPLMRRVRELSRRVDEHPRQFENPDAAYQLLRSRWRKKRLEVADLERAMRSPEEEYRKYAVERAVPQEQVISTGLARLGELKDLIDELEEQRAAIRTEVRELGLDPEDYARLEELQKNLKTVDDRIAAAMQEQQEITANVRKARDLLETYAARAADLKERLADLEAVKADLEAERDALRRRMYAANQQEDLRRVRLRIHKRLAQALSVFVFALLGVPIGVLAGGRSAMIPFGISFAIVLAVFYPLLILGQIAAEAGVLPVVPAVWAGDGLTLVIGLILLIRVMLR